MFLKKLRDVALSKDTDNRMFTAVVEDTNGLFSCEGFLAP